MLSVGVEQARVIAVGGFGQHTRTHELQLSSFISSSEIGTINSTWTFWQWHEPTCDGRGSDGVVEMDRAFSLSSVSTILIADLCND